MPSFLVESYLPRSAGALESASERARRAAELAMDEGLAVHYVRTTLLGADETCFHMFDAESLQGLEAALAGASLAADRISEAAETSARDAAPSVRRQPDERSTR